MTPDQDLKALWRTQETETHPMSIELIHARAFQSRVKGRNVIEYVACAAVVALFLGYSVFFPHVLIKLGSVMVAIGAVVIAWQLHRRGSARSLPVGASAGSSLAFHRAELVRQRDALRSAVWWYLAPMAPGLTVFMAGLTQARPNGSLANLIPVIALIGLYLGAWTLMNRAGTKRLQREIDEIDQVMTD